MNHEKANLDIRAELKAVKIPLWRLAIKQECNEVTMVRRLRLELPEHKKQEIRKQIIEILAEEGSEANDR